MNLSLCLLLLSAIVNAEVAVPAAQQFKLFQIGDDVNSVVIKSADGKWCISTASGGVKAVQCDSTSADQKLVLQSVNTESTTTDTETESEPETIMKQSDPLYQYCSAKKQLPTDETVANVKSWSWDNLWGRDVDVFTTLWAREFRGIYADKDCIKLSLAERNSEPSTGEQLALIKDALSSKCVPIINCNSGNPVQLGEPSYTYDSLFSSVYFTNVQNVLTPVEDKNVRNVLTKQILYCLVKHISDNQTFPFLPEAPQDKAGYCKSRNVQYENMEKWLSDSSLVTKYPTGYAGKNFQVSHTGTEAFQVWSKPEIDSALFSKTLREECIPSINCNSDSFNNGIAFHLSDAHIGKGLATEGGAVDYGTLNPQTNDATLVDKLQYQLAYCMEKRLTGAEFPFFVMEATPGSDFGA